MNTRITIRNPLEAARVLTLEPWGGQYNLSPGDQVDLVVEGLQGEGLGFELDSDGLTLTANAKGMDVTVFRGGKPLVAR